ncbi:divergent polysaccharide deacetylase family protein [Utexia brackfieldae]|uniref:divergent polysaccharide deacetylase family protein n=1 Tax=Utexia brackfieldae TaxID=3074108 RepID=UPI00370D9B31
MIKVIFWPIIGLLTVLGMVLNMAHAAQLAIVIDDFGYRQHNEMAIINLSDNITVAVLPNATHAQQIATYAHEHGNEVIIHLPMAPMGKQPLEKDTLFPDMSQTEIDRIVTDAVNKVPYAIGVNNHMGSLMTASLSGMDKVMLTLSQYDFFFLDSRTINTSKVPQAAATYHMPVLSRNIFLDDSMKEADIAAQFELAINFARKHGHAIAIGHPYPATVNVLTQKLAQLPADITLVKLSQLLPLPLSLPHSLPQPTPQPTLGDILGGLKTDSAALFAEWFIQAQSLDKY